MHAPSFGLLALLATQTTRSVLAEDSSLGNHNLSTSRDLLHLPSPFTFYNNECRESCGEEHEDSILNTCPKCPEVYSPCNHCCTGGASALKLRFHTPGCPGKLTFVSTDQAGQDCDITAEPQGSSVLFGDCSCFAQFSSVEETGDTNCGFFDTYTVSYGGASTFYEVCLVSVSVNSVGAVVANLSTPLPPVIGVKFEPTSESETITTYFDTSCKAPSDPTHSLPYPLFPGYGKVAGTCPDTGFIDLGWDEVAPLPEEIEHYNEPPANAYWWSFLDGISVGFWPVTSSFDGFPGSTRFDPRFSTCGCSCEQTQAPVDVNGTPVQPPTTTPSQTATITYTATQDPTIYPTIQGTEPSSINRGPGFDPVATPNRAPSRAPGTQDPTVAVDSNTPTPTSDNQPDDTSSPDESQDFASQVPSQTPSTEPQDTLKPTCQTATGTTESPSQAAQKGPDQPLYPSTPTQNPDGCNLQKCLYVALNKCRTFGLEHVPDGALCLYSGRRYSRRTLGEISDTVNKYASSLAAPTVRRMEQHDREQHDRKNPEFILFEMRKHLDRISLLDALLL